MLGKYFIIRVGYWFFFIYLIFSIICLLAIVWSPGTFQRSGDTFNWSIFSMLQGFFIVLKEYLSMSLWAIIGGVFLGLVFDLKGIGNKIGISLFSLILGISTIIPFSPIPMVASKHTSIFFQIFIFVSIIFFTRHALDKFRIIWILKFKRVFILFFILFFSHQILIQLYTGRKVKIQMDNRFKLVEMYSGNNIPLILPSIEIPSENWVSRFWDMEDDPKNFFNQSFQKYFDTGEIMVK